MSNKWSITITPLDGAGQETVIRDGLVQPNDVGVEISAGNEDARTEAVDAYLRIATSGTFPVEDSTVAVDVGKGEIETFTMPRLLQACRDGLLLLWINNFERQEQSKRLIRTLSTPVR